MINALTLFVFAGREGELAGNPATLTYRGSWDVVSTVTSTSTGVMASCEYLIDFMWNLFTI